MICYKRYMVTVGELWFAEEPSEIAVDVLRFLQRSQPVPQARCTEKWSIEVDLTRQSGELFARFKKETRYEIRRACEKDKLVFSVLNGGDHRVLEEFCSYYDQFSRRKGLPSVDAAYLKMYGEAARLVFSRARSSGGDDLVWHSYLVCGDRVRLLHSASQFRASSDSGFRNLVGRANRFLHWHDMLHFKEHGCTTYDFGGWYSGQTDREKLAINRFKEEFGGQIVCQYDCLLSVSIKGKLALAMKRVLSRS